MEQISIISNSTGTAIKLFTKEPFCTVRSAVHEKNLMGDDTVKLQVVSSQLLNFGKGDYMILDGEEYSIRTQVSRELIASNYYVYDITLYGVMYELMKSLYRNTDAQGRSTKSTFDLTYSLKDFAKVIIYNMNRDYPGKWSLDETNCPDTEPVTINFANQNCLQVLQTLCKEENFNVDFRITQSNGVRTIHIGSFGSVINPPGGESYFEWGKGNGIYDLKEEKVDDQAIKTRLWVEGGTTNIKSGYRNYSDRLQLPYPRRLNNNRHVLRNGTVVQARSQTIGISSDSNRYHEDEDLADEIGSDEEYKSYDEIYPKRTGSVTSLVSGDECSFIDSSMDFDLNAKDQTTGETLYLIASTSAKITFISGKLAGTEFELKKYDHTSKKFTLIPYTDERGQRFPTSGSSSAFPIATGDKYKITDINMPDSVVANAEEDLWYESIQDFNDMKQPRVKYTLTLDRMYLIQNTSGSEVVFHVGDYVPLKDSRFGVQKNIRITKVSRNILLAQDYSITLSDTTTISVAAQTVIDVIEHDAIIEANRLRNLTKARKAWRTTEELRNMVYDTDGYFDPENIRPNSIDTNMLTVGSKSQQFILIYVLFEPNYQGNKNVFKASSGTLCHLTIDENQNRTWGLNALQATLGDSGGYYVFAKCSKSGNTATWLVTQTQYKVENDSDPNNYYFQVGMLSSNSEGFRDFVTTYGYTRINGNTITTGKIVTSDGECYLDLDGNKFRIGDASSSVDWNVTAQSQITLKNVLLRSQSGDTVPIGVYRGVYNNAYTYYKGDEVSYTSSGETCTYRYINNTPGSGHAPTNTTYWSVVANGKQGAAGKDGLQFSLITTPGYYEKDGNLVDSYIQVELKEIINGSMVDRAWNHENTGFDTYPYSLRWYAIDKDGDRVFPATGGQYYWSQNYVGNGRGSNQCIYDEKTGDNAWKVLKINYPSVVMGSSTSNVYGLRLEVVDESGKIYVSDTVSVSKKGNVGDYFEYRYAVNGSTSQAPSYTPGSRNPGSSWSTTIPTVGSLQYLWMIIAKVSGADETLLQNWSTPVRVTPQDGAPGKSPALVYRGVFDQSKTYYGNDNRVDAVKYGGVYYVARIDAGTINPGSWDSSKWNNFGAQFDSIATDLLLAENASIGDWIFYNGHIYSASKKLVLNGSDGEIVATTNDGSPYKEGDYGARIQISAKNGILAIDAVNPPSYAQNAAAYMAPTGIFANFSATCATAAYTGKKHYGAIVALGNGNKDIDEVLGFYNTLIAGIYGTAQNSGTAPAFGGYFEKLCAAGLNLLKVDVGESTSAQYLGDLATLVIGMCSSTRTVYLPGNPQRGQVIFFKQWQGGTMRVRPYTGHLLYDDTTVNEYYDFAEGYGGVMMFTVANINGVSKGVWLVNRWRY